MKHSSRLGFAAPLGVLLAGFCAVSPVLAQPTGVHIDPGGAAGREYAVPTTEALDQTKSQAPGDQSIAPGVTSGGGGPSAPGVDGRLFGVGLESTDRAVRGDHGKGPLSMTDGQHFGRDMPSATRVGDRSSWSNLLDGEDGESTLWLLAIPACVLIAAGALALVLRRTRPAT